MGDIKEREEENTDLVRERAEREYAKEDDIEPEEHRETYPASSRHSPLKQTRSVVGSVDGRNRPLTESIYSLPRQRYSPTVDTAPRHYREIQPDSMAANKVASMLKLNFGSFQSTGSVVPPPKPFSVNANYYTDPHYSKQSPGSFDRNRNGSHQFRDHSNTGRFGAPWSRQLPGMRMPIMRAPIARYMSMSSQPIMGRPIPWRHAAVRPVMPYRATIVHHISPRYF